MIRFTLRLAIALLTFLFSLVITALLAVRPFRSTEAIQVSVPAVAEFKVISNHPEGWKKIDADNKFSFYLPPDMKEVDLLGCPFGIRKYFGNQSLMVGYDYIPNGVSEYGYRGKSFCVLMERSLADQTMYRSSEVEIGDRRARQIFWQVGDPKHNQMMLCFPDLGDGTILKFGVSLGDEQALDIAYQVLDSLEFR